MIRATTPIHCFLFDIDPTNFKRIQITYSQSNRIILKKEKEDLTIDEQEKDGKTVWIALFDMTQAESRRFNSRQEVKIQVRVLTTHSEALASNITMILVQDVLNDEVLR